MIFGRGDHMLDHLSHALYTFPVFLGIEPCLVRPLAVDDVVKVLLATLVDGRLQRKTVPLVGPTEIEFNEVARQVAKVIGKRRLFLSVPVPFHYLLARLAETVMEVPLISLAQVKILREQVFEAACAPDLLPPDLYPSIALDDKSIRDGLPEVGRFRLSDLRCYVRVTRPRA
jgi:uncharacterized protein YbjT (DUF2867 family)